MAVTLYGETFSAEWLFYDCWVYVLDMSPNTELSSDTDDDKYYDDLSYHGEGFFRTGDKVKGKYYLTNTSFDGVLRTSPSGTDIPYTISDPSKFFVYPILPEIGGLWHLEGREVSVLVDGNVIDRQTVSNGKIDVTGGSTADGAGGGINHPGLRYVTDIETLDIEAPQSTIQRRQKNIHRVSVKVEKTRGIRAGPDKDRLENFLQRMNESYAEPTHLRTGKFLIHLEPHWNSNGRLLFRQTDPLPMTILSISPDLEIEDV